jgi:hypothetical protein
VPEEVEQKYLAIHVVSISRRSLRRPGIYCYGTLPRGMSLGQLPLTVSKENIIVSQSAGRNVYVSRMEFVSALLPKFRVFGLPYYSIPPCGISCGHNSLITDVASVNQNYTCGAKGAQRNDTTALFRSHVDSQ